MVRIVHILCVEYMVWMVHMVCVVYMVFQRTFSLNGSVKVQNLMQRMQEQSSQINSVPEFIVTRD